MIIKSQQIYCDGPEPEWSCRTQEIFAAAAPTARETRREARAAGWKTPRGRDLCPACASGRRGYPSWTGRRPAGVSSAGTYRPARAGRA